ncbi:hypothetical protein FSARC_13636 [Fusarium sarcochroum]|uniref:Glutathione S-transferase UstS-like C-terminal domain-containing protein n=1 Tax=Fusarium sarcochroum TaxID=1208366 RepID=A0A8H4WT02_9HYPO|nr:hypothetical protein FSARC_13636 [Fusarium sarcochroum]
MPTTSASSSPIIFYDIATRPPVEKTCCSPNPWKSRLALKFKDVALKVPACRKFADGKDFFTLPIIEDPATGSLIGDSFDIAVYLHKTYPSSGGGDLFPAQTLDFDFKHPFIQVPLSECRDSEFPEYAKLNMNVDAAFTAHTQLTVQGFPFDPATEDITRSDFAKRVGVTRWEDLALVGEERDKLMDSFRDMLGGLGKLFMTDTTGPFLLGTKVSYADMMVGAWLRMMHVTLPESEWTQVTSWHHGLFGKFSLLTNLSHVTLHYRAAQGCSDSIVNSRQEAINARGASYYRYGCLLRDIMIDPDSA